MKMPDVSVGCSRNQYQRYAICAMVVFVMFHLNLLFIHHMMLTYEMTDTR